MYHVSARGVDERVINVDERMINVHYYYCEKRDHENRDAPKAPTTG